ncbi:MAG: DUF4178 domain-containing protein [Lachnospiraceae bacterium]|nr:DUF4178 domain-containing protein [Lachnospiraceae bacterium]
MDYSIGTKLRIRDLECTVIGFIEYANMNDGYKRWKEYRLQTNKGEFWLSVDDVYHEYSMSFPANDIRGNIGPEWHKVDEGRQKVMSYGGYVDVDPGETAGFVEFEDATEEKTLSTEIWEDGTEYSYGYYIEPNEIVVTGYSKIATAAAGTKTIGTVAVAAFIFIWLMGFLGGILGSLSSSHSIKKYIEKSSSYAYVTSITGSQNQKADVYEYATTDTTDNVAMNIINGIEGDTESITQKDDVSDDSIAILTKKEYCLIYHPEGMEDKVYVQVSGRKYNYTSDNEPYRSSAANTSWYRSHYYSAGYASDASSYSGSPSAYKTYSGDTIHNVGNGYFDSYSSSVRQSSINSRSSSSGGGK